MDEQRALKLEKLRRLETRAAIVNSCHAKQRDVIVSKARYKAILAGRRSGKTMLVARGVALSIEESGHDDWTFYSAVTRVVAKDLIWPKLEELNKDYQLGWEMKGHESVIVSKRGGMFRVLGFDDSGQIEKSAGYRVRSFFCDEPHSYATKLKYLAEQKITAALGDLRGTLWLTGTPGVARAGYWFQASTGKLPEYARYHWTVRSNPLFPRNPEEWIAEELALKQWTVETPAFRREILAEWCEDEGAQVYAFVYERNAIDSLEIDLAGLFTLGLDFGVNDACAWCLLYTPPGSRIVYVIRAIKKSGLLPDEANEITAKLVEEFNPSRIVGDAGGLGKVYVESWNRRYGHRAGWHMAAAEKTEKLANIAIVNGELRSARVMVLVPECDLLVEESADLVWADERREKEHPGLDNHLCDAGLNYAFRAHTGYLNELPKPKPTVDEAAKLAQLERINRVQAQLKASKEYDSDY